MSAALKPLTVEEFLAWEREQPFKYEFDGIEPHAMTGGTSRHALLAGRLISGLGRRLVPPCEVFSSDLKIMTESGKRVRYPDVTVSCGPPLVGQDSPVDPTVLFEITSPSSVLTDERVKPIEYRRLPSLLAYVILDGDEPSVRVMRRSTGWVMEPAADLLELPEIGVTVPLDELYAARS